MIVMIFVTQNNFSNGPGISDRLLGLYPHLLTIVVLAVADGLFGLCGSDRFHELFISTPPTLSPSLINLIVSMDVKRDERRIQNNMRQERQESARKWSTATGTGD